MKKHWLLGSAAIALATVLGGCAGSGGGDFIHQALAKADNKGWSKLSDYDRGKHYLQVGDFGLAIEAFGTDLQQNPASVPSLNGAAIAYQRIGRADVAEKLFRRALQIEPNSTFTLSNLAYLHLTQGDRSGALALVERAKTAPTDNATVAGVLKANEAMLTPAVKRPVVADNRPPIIEAAPTVPVTTAPLAAPETAAASTPAAPPPAAQDEKPAAPAAVNTPPQQQLAWETPALLVPAPVVPPHVEIESPKAPVPQVEYAAPETVRFPTPQIVVPAPQPAVAEPAAMAQLQPEPQAEAAASAEIALPQPQPLAEPQTVRLASARIDVPPPPVLAEPMPDAEPAVTVDPQPAPAALQPAVAEPAALTKLQPGPQAEAAAPAEIALPQPLPLAEPQTVRLASARIDVPAPPVLVEPEPVAEPAVAVSPQPAPAAPAPVEQALPQETRPQLAYPQQIRIASAHIEVPPPAADGNPEPAPPPPQTPEPPPAAVPGHATLSVVNGSGQDRLARRIGRYLKGQGYRVSRLANAQSFDHRQSLLFCHPQSQRNAEEIARTIPVSVKVVVLRSKSDRIELVAGRDLDTFGEHLAALELAQR